MAMPRGCPCQSVKSTPALVQTDTRQQLVDRENYHKFIARCLSAAPTVDEHLTKNYKGCIQQMFVS